MRVHGVALAGVLLGGLLLPGRSSGQVVVMPRQESQADSATLAGVLRATLGYIHATDVAAQVPDSSGHVAPEGPVAIDVAASVNRDAVQRIVTEFGSPTASRLETLRCVQPRVDCVYDGVSAIGTVHAISVHETTAEVDVVIDTYYLRAWVDGSMRGRTSNYAFRLSLEYAPTGWTVVGRRDLGAG